MGVGNILYAAITPILPREIQENPYGTVAGVMIDFWLCAGIYALLHLYFGEQPKHEGNLP